MIELILGIKLASPDNIWRVNEEYCIGPISSLLQGLQAIAFDKLDSFSNVGDRSDTSFEGIGVPAGEEPGGVPSALCSPFLSRPARLVRMPPRLIRLRTTVLRLSVLASMKGEPPAAYRSLGCEAEGCDPVSKPPCPAFIVDNGIPDRSNILVQLHHRDSIRQLFKGNRQADAAAAGEWFDKFGWLPGKWANQAPT